MQVLHYLLVQNKYSSFKYFFTAEKETEESNVISQEYLYMVLLKELYENEKNTQATIINGKWLLSFVHGTDTQVWLGNSVIPLDWG